MQATEKLDEARYFLDKLRITPQNRDHEKEFMYLLSAFLNAVHSVLDIMLYDYAEGFSLGFTRDEKFTDRDFEVASRAKNDNQALEFILWWKQQSGVMAQRPLWLKRNVIIHRGYPEIRRVHSIFIADTIAVNSILTASVLSTSRGPTPDTLTITATTGPHAIPTTTAAENVGTTTAPNVPTTSSSSTRTEFYFKDLPDRNILDYCQETLNDMEEIVNSAINRFGS